MDRNQTQQRELPTPCQMPTPAKTPPPPTVPVKK